MLVKFHNPSITIQRKRRQEMPNGDSGWPKESEVEMVTRIVSQKDQYKQERDAYAVSVGVLERRIKELENTIRIMQQNKD